MVVVQKGLWTFRIAEVSALLVVWRYSPRLAHDILYALFLSPVGVAHFISHGSGLWIAASAGVLGGMLFTFNLWLIAYYDLARAKWMRNLVKKIWPGKFPDEAPGEISRSPLLSIVTFAIAAFDIPLGIVTGKFFRLLPGRVLVTLLLASFTRNVFLGGAVSLFHRVESLKRSLPLVGLVLFIAATVLGMYIVPKLSRAKDRMLANETSPVV